jgi:hypothetical protein
MHDMQASAEKLRTEADYAEQIARSATVPQKRELSRPPLRHDLRDF